MAGSGPIFVKRTACIICGGARHKVLATGLYGENPVRAYIERDRGAFDPLTVLSDERWTFLSCHDCGAAFHQFTMTHAWAERRYGEWTNAAEIRAWEQARGYATFAARWTLSREYVQHLLRLEKLTRPIRDGMPRLLDFGSGFGHFVRLATAMNFEAVGVDRMAAKRSADILADLDDVTGKFHAITLFEVLEHLEDPLSTLARLVSMLHPGGIVVLETPNCEGITGITSDPVTYDLIHPLEHINAFTPDTLRRIAQNAGLTPMSKPFAIVATDVKRAAKDLAAPLKRPTTRQYFRRSRQPRTS